MKKLHRTQLAWAAFALALALATGSLIAQDGEAAATKPKLMAEALKARDEGDLQAAKAKFEALLSLDAKDVGAIEGLASVNIFIAEAEAAKKAADAPKPDAPADGAASNDTLLAQVDKAINEARQKSAAGDHTGALEQLAAAGDALASVVSPAAQSRRDAVSLAKQSITIVRDAGGPTAAKEEVNRLVLANADSLGKQGDVVSSAESLIRQGTAESIDKALGQLDAADRSLGSTSPLLNARLKERIKDAKGNALARRALVAIAARDMSKAAAVIGQYADHKGKDDASVVRLQKELTSKANDPTYRNIDELSPGLRVKDDKVNELLVKGRARYLYGDYQGALEAYREVLQYQPNNSESKAYQIRIREMLSSNSGQWNRGVTKGKLLELLDETWKLPEVFNRENAKIDSTNGNDPVIEKMKSIQLPEGFIVRDQPLDRALVLLQTQAAAFDKDQKGVNIVLLDPANKNPTVNLQLRNVSVYQALDYTCKRVGFSFTVGSGGIVEVREDTGDSLNETEIYPLSTAAVLKMTGLSAGGGGGGGGGAPANPFGGAPAGGAGAGDGQRPEEVAIRNFLSRSGVSFEPPATLSYDGTNLIVYQTRKNLDRVQNIIRRYSDIKQVFIEAKFMEVEQKVLNELGVNWKIDGVTPRITGTVPLFTDLPPIAGSPAGTPGTRFFTDNGSPAQGGQLVTRAESGLRSVNNVFQQNNNPGKALVVTTGTNSQSFNQNAPTFPGGPNLGNDSYTFGGKVGVLGAYDLSVLVRAIEQSNGADLMSSPSLTVLDGKTAVIKVAQLLRYPQAYGDVQSNVGNGGGGTTVTASSSVAITAGTPQDFTVQEVGVTLEVTPTVGADDSIALNLRPKVTEFEGFVEYGGTSVAISGGLTVTVPSGFFQPIFSTREVQTDVTVFDGATVVIGGLTREEVKTVEDKVPFLGSIPLIGAAFRSTGKSVSKRSLMVFVTANLVSPGGASLRSSHPGMRAGSTFSNPTIISPGGAVYREPIEVAAPVAPAPVVIEPAK